MSSEQDVITRTVMAGTVMACRCDGVQAMMLSEHSTDLVLGAVEDDEAVRHEHDIVEELVRLWRRLQQRHQHRALPEVHEILRTKALRGIMHGFEGPGAGFRGAMSTMLPLTNARILLAGAIASYFRIHSRLSLTK